MAQTEKQIDKVKAVRDYIAHTTGTENYYRHALMRGFQYTDGVRVISEICGAYWLIDLIASHQLKAKVRREPFQVWHLEKEAGAWVIRCWTDTPHQSKRLSYQKIEYSDFPDDLLPFTLWVESGVLLLPAEH